MSHDGESGDAPAVDPVVLACRRLLLMVAALHGRGYESLRVLACMSPSGAYWRCEIGPSSTDESAHLGVGFPRARYSSSGGAECYDWGDCSALTIEQLADRFEASFQDVLDQSRAPKPDYVAWFADMLVKTEPAGVMYAFADYEDGENETYVLGDCAVESLPLPPDP